MLSIFFSHGLLMILSHIFSTWLLCLPFIRTQDYTGWHLIFHDNLPIIEVLFHYICNVFVILRKPICIYRLQMLEIYSAVKIWVLETTQEAVSYSPNPFCYFLNFKSLTKLFKLVLNLQFSCLSSQNAWRTGWITLGMSLRYLWYLIKALSDKGVTRPTDSRGCN